MTTTATEKPRRTRRTKAKSKPEPKPELNRLAAVRGSQSGREYYAAMIPAGVAVRIWEAAKQKAEDLPVSLRWQREVNAGRATKLAAYLLARTMSSDNCDEYVLPAIVASIDDDHLGYDAKRGSLMFSNDAGWLINDGQHRLEALLRLKQRRSDATQKERRAIDDILDEHLTFQIFWDCGLRRAQQMFVDINRNACKPNKAINLMFDHQMPLAAATRRIMPDIFPDSLVMYDRTSVPKKHAALHAFSSLHAGTKLLLGVGDADPVSDAQIDKAAAFWRAVYDAFEDWQAVAAGHATSAELREEKLHAHGIAVEAIGRLGNLWLGETSELPTLAAIDWSRSREEWTRAGVIVDGRIVKSSTSVRSLALCLKQELES